MTPSAISQSPSGGSVTNVSQIRTTTTTATASKVGTLQSASLKTAVLNGQQSYLSTLAMSSVFLPVSVSTSSPARVELYATNGSQLSDLSRPASVSPGSGTAQGLLLDVTINSSPFTWTVTPAVPGANADNPRKPVAYITVTNLSQASLAITVSIQYVILQL